MHADRVCPGWTWDDFLERAVALRDPEAFEAYDDALEEILQGFATPLEAMSEAQETAQRAPQRGAR